MNNQQVDSCSLRPSDLGIPKLSAEASQVQQAIWWFQINFIREELTGENSKDRIGDFKATVMMLAHIEPEMLELLFGSRLNIFLQEPSIEKIWNRIKKYIYKPMK